MIWDEQKYITDDAVMLVLSNTDYDTNDYIHNYDEFVKMKKNA